VIQASPDASFATEAVRAGLLASGAEGHMTYPYRMMPLIRPWADAEPALRAGPLAGAAGNLTAKGDAMPLASSSYSYPLLGAFWTIFMIFLWVIWIWILVRVFIDIFRSRDLSGWAKALWFLFVLFIPIIGVVVYLIARGDSMSERTEQQAREQDAEFRGYVQEAAADSPASTADQLAQLADLRDRGVITAGEFEREKAKVLAA
jgi:Short C-terminal domain/Phospholipase_D-nuclease N-terminal